MTDEQRHELIRRLEAGEELSHLIYAGADMIIVPSLFEPCGLTQMNPRSIAPSACGIPTRNISAS